MTTFRAGSPDAFSELDNTTILTPATPPESTIDDADIFGNKAPSVSSTATSVNTAIPWPGRTFILRTALSNRILTLRNGQVVLSSATSKWRDCRSNHWACIEKNGWLGFCHVVSGKFLGHDKSGRLVCAADEHRDWERFHILHRPLEWRRSGGYVLMMLHDKSLWHVDAREERGVERLAKYGVGGAGGMNWEFIEVDEDEDE